MNLITGILLTSEVLNMIPMRLYFAYGGQLSTTESGLRFW